MAIISEFALTCGKKARKRQFGATCPPRNYIGRIPNRKKMVAFISFVPQQVAQFHSIQQRRGASISSP